MHARSNVRPTTSSHQANRLKSPGQLFPTARPTARAAARPMLSTRRARTRTCPASTSHRTNIPPPPSPDEAG
eukprot:330982-Chlamydomonas_euryale.AAC.1